MTTDRNSPFDRAVARLAPPTSGRPLAPAGSGNPPKPDIDEQAFAAVGTTGERVNAVLERARQRASQPVQPEGDDAGSASVWSKIARFAGKTLMGGTKWGVITTSSGIKLVNPLKTITSGLHWSQQNVTDPIAGYVVGAGAIGLSSFDTLDKSRIGKAADQYRRDVLANGLAWSASGKFTREREALFPGEKFITSIAVDPLTYVGFGWLGKIPVVGKLALGPIENAYIQATNLPFRQAARIARKLPLVPPALKHSRSQRIRQSAASAQETVREAAFEATNKSLEFTTREDLVPMLQQVTDMTVPYGALASNSLRKMRDVVYELPPVTVSEAKDLWARAGAPFDRITHHQRFALTDKLESAIKGTASQSEVADWIVATAGNAGGRQQYDKLVATVGELVARKHREVIQAFAGVTPRGLLNSMGVKAAAIRRNKLASQFEAWAEGNGQIGAIVASLDRGVTRVWHHGVQRWIARPMASAILMTPGFPMDNVLEDVIRQGVGRSGIGFQTVETFSRDVAGYGGVSSTLLNPTSAGASATSRVGLIKQIDEITGKEAVGLPQIITKVTGGMVKLPPEIVEKGDWLGAKFYQKANEWSAAMRRKLLHSRAVQRVAAEIDTSTPELGNAIHAFPKDLKAYHGLIEPSVILRAPHGGAAVRNLNLELNASVINKREASALIDTYASGNGLGQRSRLLLDDWLQTSGKKETLGDVVRSVESEEWDRFVASGKHARIQLESVVEAIKQLDPANAAQVENGLKLVELAIEDFVSQPRRLSRATVAKIRRGEFGRAAQFNTDVKNKLLEETERAINEAMIDIRPKVVDLAREAERLLGNAAPADYYIRRFDFWQGRWEGVKKARKELFASTTERDDAFWDRFNELSDEWLGGQSVAMMERGFGLERDRLMKVANQAIGGQPTRVNARTIPADAPLTHVEVAEILGMQPEQVSSSILAAAFFDKASFIEIVKMHADLDKWRLLGDVDARLGKVYDQILGNLGLDDKIHSAFRATEEGLKGLSEEVGLLAAAPKFTDEHARVLGEYLESVATAADRAVFSPSQIDLVLAAFPAEIRSQVKSVKVVNETPSFGFQTGDLRVNPNLPVDSQISHEMAHILWRNKPKLHQRVSEITAGRFHPERQQELFSEAFEEWFSGKLVAGIPAGSQTSRSLNPAAVDDIIKQLPSLVPDVTPVRLPRGGQLKERSQLAFNEALEDMKQSLVNYDDATMVDAFMQSIFPFWTYEARRIPFLLRMGIQVPQAWKYIGPQGIYWDATDDGYIRPGLGIGMEYNFFSGTAFNAPRRIFRATFPPPHEGGIRGYSAETEEVMNRFGFYIGPHLKLLADGIFPALTGGEVESGSFVPTAYQGVLAAAGAVPFTGPMADNINRMKELVLPDRFRERQMLKELWEMGLPAHEINPETLEPQPGSAITQDDLREARRRTAFKEFIESAIGKVRFRGDDEKDYREAKIAIWEAAGLSREQQLMLQREGIPFSSVVALPPPLARLYKELPGREDFAAANTLLKQPMIRAMAVKKSHMWDMYRNRVDALANLQDELDGGWAGGEVAPVVWREQTRKLADQRAHILDTLRGTSRSPETGEVISIDPTAEFADVPLTPEEEAAFYRRFNLDGPLPLRHPLEDWLNDYYSITPKDLNGDGQPEWGAFFKMREAILNTAPADLLPELLARIDASVGETERVLRELNRGKLGDYWDIERNISERMRVTSLVDQRDRARHFGQFAEAESLKRNPRLRQFDQAVRTAKERARLSDPQIDYALNVFGFTGDTLSFKNRVAAGWWRADGKLPNLARFNTGRQAVEVEAEAIRRESAPAASTP